ncbi:Receptor-type tyrosine-protein phosphatase alpha [Wickerhamomyces ciferrii]|uniref:Receptor-type tyrosine-protein phosphatase alpha n=1 Tax=Wickerhamomyces ciferrii (strain ATCC 14091 / BCRC 22168 / CBS 111 / JCM 3599 / NBRC 0793 / NRRL Y-1031 F-60-10) TaxID=1206466 RepID=K0KID0_WICCF|nr:Receptor-type tyrosine-protein phosphatase alpha [Wickerhamomyces ciferrii]CCH41154.1 Receptor-type tyrosine-protein phosphatase alpha [Wickerhamomyces ciferrii]
MIQLLILALLPISTFGASEIGCYSSLPSSFSDQSTFNFQSSSHCSDQCSNYAYFALTKGNTCICGNSKPSGSTSNDCNSKCFGYGQEMCGGDDAYSVYSTGNDSNEDDSSSSSSGSGNTDSTTSSSTSTSTSSTSTSSTNSPTTTTNSQSTTTTSSSSNPTTTSNSNTSSKETVLTTNDGGKTSTVVQTVAATESSSPTSSNQQSSSTSSSNASSSSSSDSKKDDDKGGKKTNLVGPVVGGVVGGVALVALISLLFFFLRRRTSTKRDAELADSAYYDAIKRDNSTVARPLSNPFLSKEDYNTDQRLNPVMLGRRRISEGSLADEADYSRKILRVANPDDDL